MKTATKIKVKALPIKQVWADDIKERFLGKVRTPARIRTRFPDKCWHWGGALNEKGYGIFRMPWGAQRAHRIAFLIFNDLPRYMIAGLDVHHTCENNDCVNPGHLACKDGEGHDILHATARARSQKQAGRRYKKR